MALERWNSLLSRNKAFAATHEPSKPLTSLPVADTVILVTCMDPRVIPEHFLQLNEMELAIVRNAGARANDALRSLHVLSAISGYGKSNLGLVVVMHHTDCGALHFKNEFIASRVKENTRAGYENQVPQKYGAIADIDEGVREDVDIIKNDPFLSDKVQVLGYVYDVESGGIRKVD